MPSVSLQTHDRLESCWRLQMKAAVLFLAWLSAAHPALTIVNEFSLTKEGRPAARLHRAPPRSAGPWTRHSKPPFFLFSNAAWSQLALLEFLKAMASNIHPLSQHILDSFPSLSASLHLHFSLTSLFFQPPSPYPLSSFQWFSLAYLPKTLLYRQSTLPTQMLLSAKINSPPSFFSSECLLTSTWI